MSTTLGPSPGAARYPQHKVDIHSSDKAWCVSLDGRTVARSDRVLLLDENGYEAVIYFPPQDVRSETMLQSESKTSCPFKGQASYFAAEIDGKLTDIAWVYPAVYEEVEPIEGYIAFYADRVEVKAVDINEE